MDFNPIPVKNIDKKYDYFYLPYSYKHGLQKHLDFSEEGSKDEDRNFESTTEKWEPLKELITNQQEEKTF